MADQLEVDKRLLELDMNSWYDKVEIKEHPHEHLENYYGLIMEDVISAGLNQFVNYQNGEIEGIYYDRLLIPLISVVKDHQTRIENNMKLASRANLTWEETQDTIKN